MSVAARSLALEDFCTTGSGGTPSRSDTSLYGGDIPWVKSGELRESVIYRTDETITKDALKKSAAKLVPEGAILIAMYGATIGRLATLGIHAATNQAICNIRPDPEVANTRYLYRALEAKVPELVSQASGGAQPNISQEKIRKTKIFLPPLDEQKRIAAILDKADQLRQKRRQAIALLDSLTQSIFLEMFGDPVSNSKGFPVVEFGSLIKSGPTNGLYKPASAYGEGTRILRINNFYDGAIVGMDELRRLAVSPKEQETYSLAEGDIVINRVNSREHLGKSALVPALDEPIVFESNMMRLSLHDSAINQKYCIDFLQSSSIKQQISKKAKDAVNQSSINQSDVKSFRIMLPPIAKQREYAKVALTSSTRKGIVARALAVGDQLFSSLQHRAFSGQL